MTTVEQNLTSARMRIAAAFDPAAFAAAGQQLITTLAEHLAQVQGGDASALNWSEPAVLVREAERSLHATDRRPVPSADGIAARVAELARQCLARGQNLH